jgi:Mg2+ and Co2+ transporter CorA
LEQIKKSEKQIEKMNENVLNMQNVVNEALKKTNPDKAVGKIAEYFETMQKHMSLLQQNSLKEQQNMLAKLAVATKTAQRPNPLAAANSLAAQEQERKNIIEGLVRGVINPGINLGGKTNA